MVIVTIAGNSHMLSHILVYIKYREGFRYLNQFVANFQLSYPPKLAIINE